MSIYELLAEQKRYFRFLRRPMVPTRSHFHGAIEFLFVESGEQKVVVGGEERILKAGEGCFADSFFVHAYEENLQGDMSCYLVGERSYFERFFTFRNGKVPPRFFAFDNLPLLDFIRTVCEKKYANEEDRYAAIEGAMHVLLADIASKNTFVERTAEKQSVLVCNVLQYAEKHASEDLSLYTISSVFGFSREHLSRILHMHLKENWNSYVSRLRARHAHVLLQQNPDLSVLEAAIRCGFDSPNTFYRAYKKEFGKSPRERNRS